MCAADCLDPHRFFSYLSSTHKPSAREYTAQCTLGLPSSISNVEHVLHVWPSVILIGAVVHLKFPWGYAKWTNTISLNVGYSFSFYKKLTIEYDYGIIYLRVSVWTCQHQHREMPSLGKNLWLPCRSQVKEKWKFMSTSPQPGSPEKCSHDIKSEIRKTWRNLPTAVNFLNSEMMELEENKTIC